MSNWLTGVIVLLIVAILADGIRRAYNLRRNSLHLSPKMKKRSKDGMVEVVDAAPEIIKSELPNGGARVIGYREPHEVRQPRKKISAKELREARRNVESPKRVPEQTRLNLNESVPILMESVEHQSTRQSINASNNQNVQTQEKLVGEHNERIDPTFSSEVIDDEIISAPNDDHHTPSVTAENIVNNETEDYEEDEDDYEGDGDDFDDEEDEDEFDEDDDHDEDINDWDEEVDDEAATPTPQSEPEEVIIINVMAFKGESFNGNDLLDVILKCGLRYGSMDIFHRYSDTKGEGTLLFSMANMVKPGTFDLDLMENYETPGVSLFMTLPINADSIQSFELMVTAANTIADTLDGELKDEQRSAMTGQTIEHCRQRIREFERKKLFRRPR